MKHGHKSREVIAPRSHFTQGPFGRLFRELPAWVPPGRSDAQRESVLEQLAQVMVEPEGSENDAAQDNPGIPAAYTYLGQFIDHDITFDPVSSLQRQNDPERLHNFRTPRFDLDNLYGSGPDDEPFLYDRREGHEGEFLIGQGRVVDPQGQDAATDLSTLAPSGEDDLPRNAQGVALIGDPRNDENIIVSQLQLVMLKFHNAALRWVKENESLRGMDAFHRAQNLVRWHYQWVVLHDFLKRVVGAEIVDDILPQPGAGKPHFNLYFYKPKKQPFMPVEFSVAAYRLGHSMIRADYALNDALEGFAGRIPIFKIKLGEAGRPVEPGPLEDLRGGRPLPQFWTLQWDRFLDLGSEGDTQLSRRLDPNLNRNLAAIPPARTNRLAFLNLARGWRMGLPSGQAVARAMGTANIYSNEALRLDKMFGHEAPLWYYILKEAQIEGNGERLGEVGGRIVAEVFAGLAKGDPNSYFNVEPRWQPTFPAAGDTFELADIIRFAGVAEKPFADAPPAGAPVRPAQTPAPSMGASSD